MVTKSGLQSAVGVGADYAQYSITMLAKLDSLGSWKRWLDFSGGTLDSGIYALGNDLNFYPNGNVFTNAFAAGSYSLITLTRDVSGLITVYIGAKKAATYSDTAGLYKVPASGNIIFIRDNVSGSATGETIGANIAYINVSNFLKTDAQVADTANNICTVATTSKITLTKALNNSRLQDTDQFTVQISKVTSTSTVVNDTTLSTTKGAGSQVTANTGTTGVFIASGGQAYTLGEVGAGTANISSYLSSIACTNATAGSTTVLPTGQLVGGNTFSLTPAILDDIRCTITNTQRPPVIRLTAALGTARQSASDQFTVSLIGRTGTVVNSTVNSTSAGATNLMTAGKGTTDFFSATAGQAYTLQETMATGSASSFSQYSKQLTCTNAWAAGTAVTQITALGQSITPVAGDVIDCTVTNSAIPTLALKQISRLGVGTFSYSGDNGWATQSVTTTSVDGAGTPTSAQSLAKANVVTNLTANLAAGWSLSAVSCADGSSALNGNTGTFGTFSGNVISIPANKILGNSQLSCTITATLGATLTVVKLVNGAIARANASDSFAIGLTSNTLSGNNSLPATCAVGTAKSVASTALTCTTDTATSGATAAAQIATFALVVDTRTTYTLSDQMGANAGSALSRYKTNFSCKVTNAGTVTTTGNAGSTLGASPAALPSSAITLSPAGSPLVSQFTILPGAADQIVCTFENQTLPAKLTISKVSNGGVDSFSFSGRSANANGFSSSGYMVTTNTAGIVATGTAEVLQQLSTLTEVQEDIKAGWELATATCTDANASLTGSTGSFGSLSGNVLAIAPSKVLAGSDLQCVFTNTYVGFSVSGRVILDDGSGNGVAHDGVPNGAEVGQSGITVRLTDCAETVYGSAITAGDGGFRLSLNAAPVGKSLCVQQVVPTGSRMVSMAGGTSNSTYSDSATGLTFVAAASTDYTGLVLGNARISTLSSDNAAQAVAGSSLTYAHLFTAGTTGSVTFSATNAGGSGSQLWTNVLYLDPGCSGVLSSSSTLLTGAQTVKAGDRLCLLLKVAVPQGVVPGTSNTSLLLANEVIGTETLLSHTANRAMTNADLTTVSQGGTLRLHKEFRVLNACPTDATASQALGATYVTTGSALPGQYIEYRLQYQNTASAPVAAVTIHDAVPAFTTLENAFCMRVPSRGLSGCEVALPPSNVTGSALTWSLVDGTTGLVGLQPTDHGTVAFCVRILP